MVFTQVHFQDVVVMETRKGIYVPLRFQILPIHVGGNTKVSRENVTVRFRDICQEPPRRVKNTPSPGLIGLGV